MSTLTEHEVQRFIEHGHVTLRGMVEASVAERMHDDAWRFLAGLGIPRHDRSTWPEPGPPQQKKLALHRTFDAIPSPRLTGAIDDLVGADCWLRPRRYGFFRLSWPERHGKPWELVHEGWHADSWPVNESRDAVFIMIHIGETLPGGGGTLIVSGSHRALARHHAGLSAAERAKPIRWQRHSFAHSHPWLERLASPEADPARRIEELMNRDTDIGDGIRLRAVELTGRPGDVTLCHPTIYHATNLNRSTLPRIMRLGILHLKPGCSIAGSPLARSVEPLVASCPTTHLARKEPTMSPTTDYDRLVSTMVESSDWKQRDEAQKQLKAAGRAALPAIERRLDDQRWQARRTVAQLLDNALDDTNVHVLMRALKDQNANVRRNALHSLACEDCKPEGCWNVDVVGAFVDIIKNDRSPRVRLAAISYAGWSLRPDARMVEAMRTVAATHDHPRLVARAKRVAAEIEAKLASTATEAAR
jgi:hypothetical protein